MSADPFAGHADDAHLRAVRALAERLAQAFPRAGVGITGSVAAGTHRADSDLDLVVVDASFRHDAQMAMRIDGIPAAVVCLRVDGGPSRARAWTLAAGGDARLVSMVRSARALRDPDGALEGLQRAVAGYDAERTASAAEMMALQRGQADALIRALDGASAPEPLLVRLLMAIMDGWCLREGVPRDSKAADRRLISSIRERDPALGELLRAAVPVTAHSRGPLLRAYALFFGEAPPGA